MSQGRELGKSVSGRCDSQEEGIANSKQTDLIISI